MQFDENKHPRDKDGKFTDKQDLFKEAEETVEEEQTKNKDKVDASKSFATQIDEVLSGKDTETTHIKVMNTPKVLRDLNIPDLPVVITAKHIKSVVFDDGKEKMNYHGLGAETVKKLPELLSDPVMVMKSRTKDDSIVVLTAELDKQKRPIIAAIKLNGYAFVGNDKIQANILTSVYGRNNFSSFLNKNIEENRIMWCSDEKAKQTGIFDLCLLSRIKSLPKINLKKS